MEAEQNPFFVGKVAIRFLSGPLAEKTVAIQQLMTTIGRDKENDIVVLDPKVSGRHACIRWLDGSWTIENLSQNNYVTINQQPTKQGTLQHNSAVIIIPQVIFSGAIIPLKDWLTQVLASVFPTRWAMAALGSSIGLHADKVGGDTLFGNDPTYHSTLYSVYSQTDAMHRLLLCWASLGAITLVLMIMVGIFLKRKDVRV